MSDVLQIVLLLALLGGVYILTRKYHAWKMARACTFIIQDLKQRGALDQTSSVHLPYGRKPLIQLGIKDYRPKALEYLTLGKVVGVTSDGGYYLLKG